MAKKTDAAAECCPLTDDDRAYAAQVIAKQCACCPDDAAKKLAGLKDDQVAALVEHGRNGRVADCRALLGLS